MRNYPEHGFTISNEDISVTCSSKDMEYMSVPLPIQEKHSIMRSKANVTLIIKKPDLLGFSKWSFLLNSRGIEASINDKSWLKKVHNAEIVIKAHDSISATLETTIETDESGVPIENTTKYTVIEVLNLYSSYNDNNAETLL